MKRLNDDKVLQWLNRQGFELSSFDSSMTTFNRPNSCITICVAMKKEGS